MITTPDPDYTESRLVAIGRELDLLGANGRQLPRRMIVELAYRGGWQDGWDAGAEEGNAETVALLERRINRHGAAKEVYDDVVHLIGELGKVDGR